MAWANAFLKMTIVDKQGLAANLRARLYPEYLAEVQAINEAYRGEFERDLAARSPVDLGNMQRLAKGRISEGKLVIEAGWWREDFTAEGLRWYIPYVLRGTSRMPARPVHLATEATVGPRHRAALAQALARVTNRQRG